MNMNCLIVDDVHPVLIERLQKAGITVEYEPEITKSSILARMSVVEILVVRSKVQVDFTLLECAPNLKLIGRAGAGIDNIDQTETNRRNILVVHAAEGNADAVGEHTIGMILSMLNKMNQAQASVKDGNWEREQFRGEELMGKTVGILGYGNMGRAVAKRLQSFGCRVIAYDKYLKVLPDSFAEKVELEIFFRETEILSIHLPLTEETRGMVNKEFIQSFSKNVFFVHTARGPIVPILDLIEMLLVKKVRFAALDVLEKEPPIEKNKKLFAPYDQLFDMDQVMITPHVAGWSLESYRKISEVLATKIEAFISTVQN